MSFNAKVRRNRAVIPVGWSKPPEGWAKLNTDGSVLGNPVRAGGGGVIRGKEGGLMPYFKFQSGGAMDNLTS
nr:hypothetical protein CFP56_56191 [Quercus suber]